MISEFIVYEIDEIYFLISSISFWSEEAAPKVF
jgi:hypothetical protein